jgi:hypothetical protein
MSEMEIAGSNVSNNSESSLCRRGTESSNLTAKLSNGGAAEPWTQETPSCPAVCCSVWFGLPPGSGSYFLWSVGAAVFSGGGPMRTAT